MQNDKEKIVPPNHIRIDKDGVLILELIPNCKYSKQYNGLVVQGNYKQTTLTGPDGQIVRIRLEKGKLIIEEKVTSDEYVTILELKYRV